MSVKQVVRKVGGCCFVLECGGGQWSFRETGCDYSGRGPTPGKAISAFEELTPSARRSTLHRIAIRELAHVEAEMTAAALAERAAGNPSFLPPFGPAL